MPFVNAVLSLLAEFKTWLIAIAGVLAVLVNIKDGVMYTASGDVNEKAELVKNIRNRTVMIGGIFFLAWLALYVYDKMKVVS